MSSEKVKTISCPVCGDKKAEIRRVFIGNYYITDIISCRKCSLRRPLNGSYSQDTSGEKGVGMHVTEEELQKHINKIGYRGCENCKHQISPLRSCEWREQGGDGHIHFICPKWSRAKRKE